MEKVESTELLQNAQAQTIMEFSKTLEMFGLTPAEARLFVSLYIEGKPMTLDEMSEALGKSKTSMSTGIRSLLDLNLVERVWKKGVRKDLYQANESLFKRFMSTYISRWTEACNRQMKSVQTIQEQVEDHATDNDKELNHLRRRLKDILEFHQLIENAFEDLYPE
ncbi:transcriptional regulator [Pontibacillus halophilus JSM 076056 = DSM 19796]|uniref:HTH-type transcriptional regulator n=1 Tax=Pontibacillus halophilus JSM 076056 = DSM 19796 TaxID=1385510 RepID=A0A0A5GH78_9BACI|nr:helix-turn-helix domain-containing protein [Pontibacillus halophilus]KGX92606.1 transcriptional regulator [Pontibacillus halophilus JSM 076056 = DSM 19796]